MGSYIPSTAAERQEMLEAIGCKSIDELYAQVPAEMKVERLDIPEGKSELEVRRILEGIASKNTVFPSVFRGAGAYRHYIPSIVKSVTSKETFLTAYTPYQAEISQGVLQSIFEYQTMICELTGMDVSNASVYDGATAAAWCREAGLLLGTGDGRFSPDRPLTREELAVALRRYARILGRDTFLPAGVAECNDYADISPWADDSLYWACDAGVLSWSEGGRLDPGAVAVAALYHDASEILTGDMPTPIKYDNPAIRKAYKEVEAVAEEKLLHMLPEEFQPVYAPILTVTDPETERLGKAADKLSAYIKCVEELKAGNSEFRDAAAQTRAALEEYELPEVTYFLETFMPSFSLTLDQLK